MSEPPLSGDHPGGVDAAATGAAPAPASEGPPQQLLARASALGALYQQHRAQQLQQQGQQEAGASRSGSSGRRWRRGGKEKKEGGVEEEGAGPVDSEGAGQQAQAIAAMATVGGGGSRERGGGRKKSSSSLSSSSGGGGGGGGGGSNSSSRGKRGERRRAGSPLLLQRPSSLAASTARHALPTAPSAPASPAAKAEGKPARNKAAAASPSSAKPRQQQQQKQEEEAVLDPAAAELAGLERLFAGRLHRALALLHPPPSPPPQQPQAGAGGGKAKKHQQQPQQQKTSPASDPDPASGGALLAPLAEAWAALTEARRALARAYTERLLLMMVEEAEEEAAGAGLGVGVAQRLWLLYYREVDALQGQLAQAPAELTCPRAEREARAAWRARLEAVLLEGAEALTAALPPPSSSASCPAAGGGGRAAAAAAVLMVALGDLARYAARLSLSSSSTRPLSSSSSSLPELEEAEADEAGRALVARRCLSEAAAWYGRARSCRPGWGRTYNQLAILAVMRGGSGEEGEGGSVEWVLAAAVDYTRALLAGEEPFAAAKENLLAHLDRWRRAADAAAVVGVGVGGAGGSGGGGSGGASSIDELFRRNREGRGGGGGGGSSSGGGGGGGGGGKLRRARAATERAAAARALLRSLHMVHARVDLDVAPGEARALGRYLALYAQAVAVGRRKGEGGGGEEEEGGVGGVKPRSVGALRTLCSQAVLLAAGALMERVAAAGTGGLMAVREGEGQEEEEERKLPYDVRGALALAMELGLALAGAGEAAEGWDPGRGPALLLLLEWAAANRHWLFRLPGARIGDIVRAAQRRLAHTALSPQALLAARGPRTLGTAEAELVRGLRGFLRQEEEEDEVAGAAVEEVQAARCKRLLRELEALGALSYPPAAATAADAATTACLDESGAGDDARLLSSLSDSLLSSLSLSASGGGVGGGGTTAAAVAAATACPACGEVLEAEVLAGSGVCEYCGHALEQEGEQEEDEAQRSTKKGGLLVGVDLSKQQRKAAAAAAAAPPPRLLAGGVKDPYRVVGGAPPPPPPQQQQQQQQQGEGGQGRLVVIDAANVAMRHGMGKAFSCKGIALALDFFRLRGHRALAFLPETYLDFDRVGALRRASKALGGVRAAQLPDNVHLLRALAEAQPAPLLVTTPPQDYDDSYCIRYAQAHGGCVVTNDQYRDQLSKLDERGTDKEEREALRKWLKGHLISFTFVGDEFIPNPDFRFG